MNAHLAKNKDWHMKKYNQKGLKNLFALILVLRVHTWKEKLCQMYLCTKYVIPKF